MEKIMEVISVDLQIWKSNPPILVINCKGTVTTSGWSNGQLSPYFYIQPPQDGIYDFDFIAQPPSGPVLQVISRISTSYKWPSFPDDLKGVRIHARDNEVVAMLTKETNEISFDTKLSEGGEVSRGIFEFEQNKSLIFVAVVLGRASQTLFLNGLVLTYHEDDIIIIEKAEPQGINPHILICNLKVKQGSGPKKVTLKPFTFQETNAQYQQVTLNYRNESVTVDVLTLPFPELILEVMESKMVEKETEMAH